MFASIPYVGRRVFDISMMLIAAWILFGAWALSSPIGSSADETFHLKAIWCGNQVGGQFCKQDADDVFARNERRMEFLVPAHIADGLTCMAGNVAVSAGCQSKKLSTQWESVFTYESLNGYATYPGYFYSFFRNFVSENPEWSVLRIRWFNGMLAGLIIVLVVTLRLPKSNHGRFGHAVLATLVPPLLFLIPSVNPTSWVLFGVPLMAVGLVDALDDKAQIRYRVFAAVYSALAGILALGARVEAGLWLTTIAFCVLAARLSRSVRPANLLKSVRFQTLSLFSGVLVTVVIVVVASTTLRRFLAFGEPVEGPSRKWWLILTNNFITLPDFLIGFVGGGTWNVAAHQRFVTPSLTIIACTTILSSTVIALWRSASSESRTLALYLTFAATTWTLLVHQANSYYIGKVIQPRYLLPLFLAAVIVLGRDTGPQMASRFRLVSISVMSIGHAVLLYQQLRRYVVGLREWENDDLGCVACVLKPQEWWWNNAPSPLLVWVFGSIGFVMFSVLLTRIPSNIKNSAGGFVSSCKCEIQSP